MASFRKWLEKKALEEEKRQEEERRSREEERRIREKVTGRRHRSRSPYRRTRSLSRDRPPPPPKSDWKNEKWEFDFRSKGRTQFTPTPPPPPPPPPLRRPNMEQNIRSESPTPAESSGSTPFKVDDQHQGMSEGSKMGPIHKDIPGETESGKTDFDIISLDGTVDDPSLDIETNQDYVFTLSNKDVDNLLPTTGADNYNKLITQQNKENLKSLKTFRDISEALNNILSSETYRTHQYDESRNTIKDNFKSLKDRIKEEEDKLKNAAALSNKFRQVLQQPAFGTNEKINIEEARLAVPLFTNEEGSSNLQDFWQKLICYSETESLTENGVKNLLSFLLQGRPYRSFYENKDKSLQDICTMLIDRFGNVTTISDKIKELESLTRRSKEKLSGVMSRAAELIDSTRYLVKETERDVRFEILMTNNLLKLASSKAKEAMLSHRARALRSGYVVQYKELLGIAIDIERQENESDKSDLYAFPVVRAQKHRHHREKPYDGYKPPPFAAPAPNQNPAPIPKPHNRGNSKPFNYGNSEYKNINDQYRKNSNKERSKNFNQDEFRPAYNYHDNYENKQYDKKWNNYGRRPDYSNKFRPKIYQGYGNYARHKYPPYPMGCFNCGLYHFGRCPNNYQYDRKYYNKNSRNDLN